MSFSALRTQLAGLLERPPASWRALGDAAFAYALSRGLVYLFVWASQSLVTPSVIAFLPQYQTGLPWWLDWGAHWDGWWYLSIVREGYQPVVAGQESNLAFWPLYPTALKVATLAFGMERLELLALLTSNGALLLGLWAFRLLVGLDLPAAGARRATLYLALFPASFFYSAYYPESLFLLASSLAWYAVRRGHIWHGGAAGAAATLTHVPGGLLLFPLLWERYPRGGRVSFTWLRSNIGLLLLPLAGLGYLLYLRVAVGDPFAFLRAARGWQHTLSWPWSQLVAVWSWVLPGEGWDPREVAPLLFTLGALALFVAALGRLRKPYLLWTALLLLLYLSAASPQPLISMPRYALHLFPLMIPLALWGERPWVNRGVLAVFITLLGVMAALFARWHWVG
ncbi:MAG: hypothetical protein HYY02_05575 [Chloroflexi bacterium]|nr:hypothetical protein [Chloroflexota bacterium]